MGELRVSRFRTETWSFEALSLSPPSFDGLMPASSSSLSSVYRFNSITFTQFCLCSVGLVDISGVFLSRVSSGR